MITKVLITGVSGFVGTSVVKALTSRNDIALIGHSRDVDKARIQFKDFNIKLIDRCSQKIFDELEIDCIIHLAGIAHDLSNQYSPADYYTVNYENTKTFYDAFVQSKVKKFVFISSVKAAMDSPIERVGEDVDPNPVSHYGISKLKAEQYIESISINDDKKYYIFRPCMMHGPGNKGNLNLLYKFVASGIPYPLAAFHNQRSFLSTDNFNFIIVQFLLNNIQQGVYHLADDESLSTVEVVEIIAEVLRRKARVLFISKRLLTWLASVGDVVKLPLNSQRLNKLTESYIVSNDKVKQSLGVNNLPLRAREGLIKTIESFKSEKLS